MALNAINPTMRQFFVKRNEYDQFGFDWGSTSLKLKDMFNSGVALLSQVIAGKQGNGQQIYNQNGQLVPVGTNNQNNNQPTLAQQQAMLLAQQQAQLNAANSAGAGIGSGIDGIVNWATANPLIVFAGIAGIYLLTREPPRYGRR